MQAQGKEQGSAIFNLLKLLGAAAVTGVLVAAVALPAVGGAGMTVNAATNELRLLPEELKEPPLAEKTTLLDANGKQFAQFYFENRESVKLDQVADVMKTAIVAIEDFRFYEHGAIDLEGTSARRGQEPDGRRGRPGWLLHHPAVRQARAAQRRRDQGGAEAAIEATFSRKLNELRYALAIEEKYTKSEILERYLNISYYGAGAYGIQAASRRFFDKPAAELTLRRRPPWPEPCRTRAGPTRAPERQPAPGCWSGATPC